MRRARKSWLAILLLESLFLAALSYAPAKAAPGIFGFGSKTLGGRFTWSDEVVYHDWRIQRSAVVGHYRLIDPEDRRYTFGTLEHCLEELEAVKLKYELPPLPKYVVIGRLKRLPTRLLRPSGARRLRDLLYREPLRPILRARTLRRMIAAAFCLYVAASVLAMWTFLPG